MSDPGSPRVVQCGVCGRAPAVTLAAVPSVDATAAYCADCAAAGAHPYGLVVAETAACGGIAETADWWQHLIAATLHRLGVPMSQFRADVAAALGAERRSRQDPAVSAP